MGAISCALVSAVLAGVSTSARDFPRRAAKASSPSVTRIARDENASVLLPLPKPSTFRFPSAQNPSPKTHALPRPQLRRQRQAFSSPPPTSDRRPQLRATSPAATLKLVKQAGLYVHLRIGPYVCAEWNFGGFPIWLKYVSGISFRTNNGPFKAAMESFTEKIVSMMKSEGLYESQGGPIILSQIENEYGPLEDYNGGTNN
ncbi:uncharacterized protein LOC141843988 [Curcuma longa]|uniref:uncharacterized protein LOC141843988 n=1 Tax=Curcuma longa TaxID=136217 RepID=UPI003D9DFE31